MSEQKMSRMALTAMVVGGMVGAGIFSLPRTFANATGPLGAVIAWLIAGTGMYMLARVFHALAERRPDIDAGVYAYAREGFGDYPGFLSAFGYWIGSCIGNVSYWVLIKSTLGAFFPVFGEVNTAIAIAAASTSASDNPLLSENVSFLRAESALSTFAATVFPFVKSSDDV